MKVKRRSASDQSLEYRSGRKVEAGDYEGVVLESKDAVTAKGDPMLKLVFGVHDAKRCPDGAVRLVTYTVPESFQEKWENAFAALAPEVLDEIRNPGKDGERDFEWFSDDDRLIHEARPNEAIEDARALVCIGFACPRCEDDQGKAPRCYGLIGRRCKLAVEYVESYKDKEKAKAERAIVAAVKDLSLRPIYKDPGLEASKILLADLRARTAPATAAAGGGDEAPEAPF